jgi:hypothetical protein
MSFRRPFPARARPRSTLPIRFAMRPAVSACAFDLNPSGFRNCQRVMVRPPKFPLPIGWRWLPRPYSTSKLDRDFRIVRAALFGKDETRQLANMRRSGAVEGNAGGASGSDMSNKMANTIGTSNRLRKVYTPVNVPSVRRFDEARERGREKLEEQKPPKSVMTPKGKVS